MYWGFSGGQSGFGIQHLKSAWAAQEIIPWLLLYIKSTPLFYFFCHFSLSSLALVVSFPGFFCAEACLQFCDARPSVNLISYCDFFFFIDYRTVVVDSSSVASAIHICTNYSLHYDGSLSYPLHVTLQNSQSIFKLIDFNYHLISHIIYNITFSISLASYLYRFLSSIIMVKSIFFPLQFANTL